MVSWRRFFLEVPPGRPDRAAQQQLAKAERELAGLERGHGRATARLAELDE